MSRGWLHWTLLKIILKHHSSFKQFRVILGLLKTCSELASSMSICSQIRMIVKLTEVRRVSMPNTPKTFPTTRLQILTFIIAFTTACYQYTSSSNRRLYPSEGKPITLMEVAPIAPLAFYQEQQICIWCSIPEKARQGENIWWELVQETGRGNSRLGVDGKVARVFLSSSLPYLQISYINF